jgi:hypothetical protein
MFIGLIIGLAVAQSIPLHAEDNKAWQESQFKKLRGRWTTIREEEDRRRLDLQFTDGKIEVLVYGKDPAKRPNSYDLRLFGVEMAKKSNLSNFAQLNVGSTSGSGKTEVYYDFVGEKLIIVGTVDWRPFEGFHLSGDFKRVEVKK